MGIKDENIDNLKLKKMVDDSLDKKFKEFSKETEKNRLTDKKEILKELKARDEKGLNTLAQKFEMLKLNKEINKEKPSKNPLVAISDKNLKWLSEHAIANQKGDNLAEIAKNFAKSFTKTHKKEDNKEDKNKDKKEKDYTTLPVVNPMEEDTASTSILKAKVTMEDKIDEIHQLITKGIITEQKTNTAHMAKGLDGIIGTMKTTQKVLGQIGDKTKQIASLVGIGALGLLYVIGWWKDGGPERLAKAIQDGIIAKLPWNKENDSKDLNSDTYTSTTASSIGSSILKNDDYSKYLDENKNKFTGIADSSNFTSKSTDGSYERQGKQFSVGNLTPVLAPIDGTISGVKSKTGSLNGGEQRMYFEFTLYGSGGSTKDSGMTQNVVQLKFENILNIKVYDGLKVKLGQLLGFADGSFKITQTMGNKESGKQILDEYQGFINKNKEDNWETAITTTTNNLNSKDYDKINSKLVDEVIDKHSQQRATSKYTNGITNVGNKITNKWALRKQEDKDKFLQAQVGDGVYNVGNKTKGLSDGYNEQPTQEVEIPKAQVTQLSENKQKINEQSDKIMEQVEKDLIEPGNTSTNVPNQIQPQQNKTTVIPTSMPNNAVMPNQFNNKTLEMTLPDRKRIN